MENTVHTTQSLGIPEALYLAIDIGGTAIKYGLITAEGEILKNDEYPVAGLTAERALLDLTCEAIEAFKQACIDSEWNKVVGIAISATGQIDSKQGIVAGTCGNFPHWRGAEIRERFEKMYQLPVTVFNDANCMVAGEAWLGAARGYRDAVGVTLGTGVGGGILCAGHILEGRRGLAGELGHFPLIATNGRRCTCGNTGCYEQYASTTALLRLAAEAGQPFANARMLCAELKVEGENGPIGSIMNAWLNHVADGLVGLVHIFNPEIIVIGGGISEQEELVIAPLRQKILAQVMPEFAKGLEIKSAQLGNRAALVGALSLHLRRP